MTVVARRPGRPRHEDLERRILDAALELIDSGQEVSVSKLVARSEVSRAAIYRRWPSMTHLLAAALDEGRSVPPAIEVDGDLRLAIFESMFGTAATKSFESYSESPFPQRIRLVMADKQLQQAYWDSHVTRRREAVESALRHGVQNGVLREDLDVEACFDALAGVAYYQSVVRGAPLGSPAVRARLSHAFDVIWRGMTR